MDEKKDQDQEQGYAYTGEVADTTSLDTPAEAQEPGVVLRDPRSEEFPNQAPSQFTPWPEPVGREAPTVSGEFSEFINRTKYIWLIAAAVIFGSMAAVTVAKRGSQKAKVTQEEPHESVAAPGPAPAAITPNVLTARCGQPAADVTKDLYPMVARTMSYETTANGNILFEFTKTAEAKSEWVFLSMKDESGTKSYETAQERVAALPCLGSQK